ncbi:MAG: hypothetical protein LBJ60_02625 [Tannerellaceae bacterium]|nr:hypothetical protein [Tannerellaceae bacterium]
MKKFSTQCMDKFTSETEQNRTAEKSMPQKKTLDFLMQLARIYHVEPNVKRNLCGFILN